jgi:hypothetical protein
VENADEAEVEEPEEPEEPETPKEPEEPEVLDDDQSPCIQFLQSKGVENH